MRKIVNFHRMKDGTREDYLLLNESEHDFAAGLADRVLAALGRLDNSLEGYPVTRLEHSLQVATSAEAAAGILRPYVRPAVTWIIERWYDACVAFCDWDQASFDPDHPTRPLAHFESLLRRILSREANDPRYVAAGA